MTYTAPQVADALYAAATPVLRIHRLDAPMWKRKIEKNPRDARIGPWLQAHYTVLDDRAWRDRGACLYLVRESAGPVRYVGISRNGVKHRWRTSPAYHPTTMERLAEDQLFHSQCWRPMQACATQDPSFGVEVRVILHKPLAAQLDKLGPPVSGFLALGDDGEGLCAAMERWLCNGSGGGFLAWNTAMTGRAGGSA